jgi:hypothetical protein
MTSAQTRRWSAGVAAVLLTGAVIHAQPAKPQTATEFYKQYQAAAAKATKIEDLTPYLSADTRKMIDATPAAQRPQQFEMMKMMMSSYTGVTVVKEDHNPDGSATLTLSGQDSDKKKATGKATIVKEAGAWKLGNESWGS